MSDFDKFRTQLASYFLRRKAKAKQFKKAIGIIFQNLSTSGGASSEALSVELEKLTGERNISQKYLSNFSSTGYGRISLAIGLYYFCFTKPEYKLLLPRVDYVLFGKDNSFKTEFRWQPGDSSESEADQPKAENNNTEEHEQKFSQANTNYDHVDARAINAWVSTKEAITILPYRSFMEHHAGTPQATDALSHIHDLEIWATIPQANPFAIHEFIVTGPFPALGLHACKCLGDAKVRYVDEKVERVVSRMQNPSEPSGALQWFGCLTFPFAALILLFSMGALLIKVSLKLLESKYWPFTTDSSFVASIWRIIIRSGFGEYMGKVGLSFSEIPSESKIGLCIQVFIVSLFIILAVIFIISCIVRAISEDFIPRQRAQVAAIREYHVRKVQDL